MSGGAARFPGGRAKPQNSATFGITYSFERGAFRAPHHQTTEGPGET